MYSVIRSSDKYCFAHPLRLEQRLGDKLIIHWSLRAVSYARTQAVPDRIFKSAKAKVACNFQCNIFGYYAYNITISVAILWTTCSTIVIYGLCAIRFKKGASWEDVSHVRSFAVDCSSPHESPISANSFIPVLRQVFFKRPCFLFPRSVHLRATLGMPFWPILKAGIVDLWSLANHYFCQVVW